MMNDRNSTEIQNFGRNSAEISILVAQFDEPYVDTDDDGLSALESLTTDNEVHS